MRAFEKSLSRLHSCRVLGWSGGRKWVPVQGDHYKHRFLEKTKIEFWAYQEQKMTFKCHSQLESSLYRLRKSHIFGCSSSRKWLQSDIWQLESSLFQLHPNCIL